MPESWLKGLLLFDRIWIPTGYDPIPFDKSEVGFYDYQLDSEVMVRALAQRQNDLRMMGRDREDIDWPNVDAQKTMNELAMQGLRRSIRYVAELYSNKGYNVTPVYEIPDQFEAEFAPGVQIAYEASFREISNVCPEHLTVKQVFDFRRDAEAVKQYRSFHLWLRDGLKAESVVHATDIISNKLECYEWAIKKHGLKTITGALSSVIDSKAIIAIASSAGMTALLSGPVWAALTGGLLAGARSLVWIAERQIDLEDTKRGQNSEVALFYAMKRSFPT